MVENFLLRLKVTFYNALHISAILLALGFLQCCKLSNVTTLLLKGITKKNTISNSILEEKTQLPKKLFQYVCSDGHILVFFYIYSNYSIHDEFF